MNRLVGLVASMLALGVSAVDECGYRTPDHLYYNMLALKKHPTSAYRVFDNDHIFTFNLCGPVQCGVMQDAPACKSPATPSNPPNMNDYEGIGSAVPVAQSLTPMDIADVNWKTQHMPPFPMTTKGVKLVYPAFGAAPVASPTQAGAGGAPSPDGQSAGQMPNPAGGQTPGGYNTPPGYSQPTQQANPWATPTPPPPANPWATGAQQQQPTNPYQQPAANPYGNMNQQQPGAAAPAMGKHSTLGMTVIGVCDSTLAAPVAMQFARAQTYKDRSSGYLFVIASKDACPTTAPDNVLGTGLNWGWFFIITFSLIMGLYCGIGMVYKYKKLGVTGIETVPNIEFWRDYPGLIKDGMAYFLSLVRSCLAKGGPPAAGGGGGSGGGYSTV